MEMILQVLLLVLGFLMLVKGADWFVDGASGIAERFGIPQKGTRELRSETLWGAIF